MVKIITTVAEYNYPEGTETKFSKPGFIGVYRTLPNMTVSVLQGEHKAKTVVTILCTDSTKESI